MRKIKSYLEFTKEALESKIKTENLNEVENDIEKNIEDLEQIENSIEDEPVNTDQYEQNLQNNKAIKEIENNSCII
jgi:hypothetical protein